MKQLLRKMALMLVVTAMVCTAGIGVLAASVTVEATVAESTLTVKVSGMSAGKQTTLMILESSKTPEQVASGDATPWYVGQEETDASGIYTYTFDVQNEPYGQYIAYAGGEDMDRGQSEIFTIGTPTDPETDRISKIEPVNANFDEKKVQKDWEFKDYITKVKFYLEGKTNDYVTFTEADVTNNVVSCSNWADVGKAANNAKVTLQLQYRELKTTIEVTVVEGEATSDYVNGPNEIVRVNARLTNNAGGTITSFKTNETGYIVVSVSGYDTAKKGFTGGTIDFTMSGGYSVTTGEISALPSGAKITSANVSGNKLTVSFTMGEAGVTTASCDLLKIPVKSNSAISNARFSAATNANGIIALTRPEGDKSILRANVGSAVTFSITTENTGGGPATRPSGGGGGGGGGSAVPVVKAAITRFAFDSLTPAAVGVINDTDGTIIVEVPEATDVTALVPTITIQGTGVTPESGVAQDFSKIVEYTVKASNGVTKKYQVSVKKTDTPSVTPPVGTDTGMFTDLQENHWAYNSVKELVEKQIVSGEAADGRIQIRPNDYITRQEAAKIAVAAVGIAVDGTAVPACADAANVDDWAKPFVAAAMANGLVNGYEDGSFNPTGNVTREELVAIIMRGFQFGESDAALSFADEGSLGWARGYVAKATSMQIINGYAEDNTFRGGATITRAEAFAVMQRAIKAANGQ